VRGKGSCAGPMHNAPPAYAESRAGVVYPPPDSPFGLVAATKQVAQVADVRTSQSYINRDPFVVSAVELGGYRTVLSVPMCKDDELIGAINIFPQEVPPFAGKKLELGTNFPNPTRIALGNNTL